MNSMVWLTGGQHNFEYVVKLWISCYIGMYHIKNWYVTIYIYMYVFNDCCNWKSLVAITTKFNDYHMGNMFVIQHTMKQWRMFLVFLQRYIIMIMMIMKMIMMMIMIITTTTTIIMSVFYCANFNSDKSPCSKVLIRATYEFIRA